MVTVHDNDKGLTLRSVQVSFTGSTEVGQLVGAAAAKNIKPCTLELGGKSAAIVWKDVDVDQVPDTACRRAAPALQLDRGACTNCHALSEEGPEDMIPSLSAGRSSNQTLFHLLHIADHRTLCSAHPC